MNIRTKMRLAVLAGVLALLACKREADTPTPAADACTLTEEQQQVIADVNQYAIPFTQTIPEAGSAALAPLDEMLSNAKIVGMGEATHGTKEFSQMRFELFKRMVTQHGYKAIAFETSWGASWYLNRYVLNESTSLVEPLSNMSWAWTNKEVLTMLKWMREYNTGKAEADKIFFYGFDVQSTRLEFKLLEEYIGQVDPQWLPSMIALYQPFKATPLAEYGSKPESFKADVRQRLQQVYEQIQNRQANYVSQSSPKTYQEVLHTVRVLIQTEDLQKNGEDAGYGALRDRYMAENAQWIRQHLGTDSKIALWAHNAHVGNINTTYTKAMGWNLKNAMGSDYQIIGFSFATGTVTAIEATPGPGTKPIYGSLQSFTVEPPICESTNYLFHQSTHKNFLLNLEEVPQGTALHTWITTPHPDRNIGAVYGKEYDQQLYFDQTILRECYDWTIYFDQTAASEQITSADL